MLCVRTHPGPRARIWSVNVHASSSRGCPLRCPTRAVRKRGHAGEVPGRGLPAGGQAGQVGVPLAVERVELVQAQGAQSHSGTLLENGRSMHHPSLMRPVAYDQAHPPNFPAGSSSII